MPIGNWSVFSKFRAFQQLDILIDGYWLIDLIFDSHWFYAVNAAAHGPQKYADFASEKFNEVFAKTTVARLLRSNGAAGSSKPLRGRAASNPVTVAGQPPVSHLN